MPANDLGISFRSEPNSLRRASSLAPQSMSCTVDETRPTTPTASATLAGSLRHFKVEERGGCRRFSVIHVSSSSPQQHASSVGSTLKTVIDCALKEMET